MAGSIFKEIAITPQTFDKSVLLDDLRKFEKLLNAMDDLSESGMIVGVYTDWINKVDEFIDQYDDNDKHEIKNVLNFLKDRQRIVCIPKNLSNSNEEDSWINQAKQISRIREFDLIIASKDTDFTKQITSLDRKILKNKGAIVESQSKEFMHTILAPILSYAEDVQIYDPYFHLHSNEERFEKALEIICTALGSNHGIRNTASINIHTSIKPMIETNPQDKRIKEFVWQKTVQWPQIIKELEKKFGHKISIYIWEEVKKENEWHDRWIITNQCGVALGKGTDISEWTDATWSLLDWNELSKITHKFNKNRNLYTFIGHVNSKEAIRERFPKKTKSRMTEEEKTAEQRTRQLEIEAEIRKREEERVAKQNNKKTLSWQRK